MNYFDDLKTGNSAQWISYLNKEYMELYAPSVKVFKLDKVVTKLDNPYTEALHSRIYLPYFEMRVFHLDNTWRQVLGEGTMPYLETQENIQFIANFENMVNIHRELKNRHSSDIYIEYTGSGEPTAEKIGDSLTLRISDTVVKIFNLINDNYRTLKKLVAEINAVPNFSASLKGENDLSKALVSFGKTSFKYEKLNLYVKDKTYKNITEVVEAGDLVLTHQYFLYEVLSNKPGGDFGWDYVTFVIEGNLRSLDKAQLPGNINRIIKEKEYGIRDKTEIE